MKKTASMQMRVRVCAMADLPGFIRHTPARPSSIQHCTPRKGLRNRGPDGEYEYRFFEETDKKDEDEDAQASAGSGEGFRREVAAGDECEGRILPNPSTHLSYPTSPNHHVQSLHAPLAVHVHCTQDDIYLSPSQRRGTSLAAKGVRHSSGGHSAPPSPSRVTSNAGPSTHNLSMSRPLPRPLPLFNVRAEGLRGAYREGVRPPNPPGSKRDGRKR